MMQRMQRVGKAGHPRHRILIAAVLQAALVVSPLVAQEAATAGVPKAPPQSAATAHAGPDLSTPSNRDRNRAAKLYVEGAKAMEAANPRQAAQDFERAAELDPSNHDYQVAAEIAREHLLTQLVQEATKAKLMGQEGVARGKLEESLKIDPQNLVVKQHIDELAESVALGNAASPYTSSGYASIQLAPQSVQHDFHLRANSTELLRQVYSAYGITALMDESVRPQSLRIDVDAVGFEKAAEMASLLTHTFFVPLDPKRVLIATDTRENRQKFERQFEETVYLPGMTASEMSDIGNVVKNVFEAQQSIVQPQSGTLTMRAPEATLRAVNATLEGLVEGRAQVLIEMRIFEIGRTRVRNIGIQLPQQVTIFNVPTEVNKILAQNAALVNQIISSGLAKAGDFTAIAAILIASGAVTGGILGQPFVVFGGGITQEGVTLGTLKANLSLNTSDSRELDQVQLRVADQETATLRSGTRYPIVTSIYSSSSIANGIAGLNTPGLSSTLQSLGINVSAASLPQNIPQVQYEDLGLTLKATPRIKRSREITLALDMKVDSLSGSSSNGNPVLNNRQYTGTITLHDGDTAVLFSNLNKQESRAVNGIPGVSEIPGFRSTTDTSKQVDVSNLMIMITPHVVRTRPNHDADPMVMIPRN
jgi:general secretion pathway protein D